MMKAFELLAPSKTKVFCPGGDFRNYEHRNTLAEWSNLPLPPWERQASRSGWPGEGDLGQKASGFLASAGMTLSSPFIRLKDY